MAETATDQQNALGCTGGPGSGHGIGYGSSTGSFVISAISIRQHLLGGGGRCGRLEEVEQRLVAMQQLSGRGRLPEQLAQPVALAVDE